MSISFAKSGSSRGAPSAVLAASKRVDPYGGAYAAAKEADDLTDAFAAGDSPRFAEEEEKEEESPRALAARYGVPFDGGPAHDDDDDDDDGTFGPDSDDDDIDDSGAKEPSPPRSSVAARGAQPQEHYPAEELEARCLALEHVLRKRSEQVKRLETMLEACGPLPGVNRTRLSTAYEDPEADVDVRDAKIVQLAKKSRAAALALRREREDLRRERERTAHLEADKAALEDEVRARDPDQEPTKGFAHQRPRPPSRGETRSTTSSEVATGGGEPPPVKPNRREQQLAKTVADLRTALHRAREENTQLNRALHKEMGDDADKSKVLDEGWRGRAQQIVMLKARVRELEEGRQLRTAPRRRDVDTAARSELAGMEKERARAVEELTEQHAALATDLKESRRKLDAAKARNEALGNDVGRGRENCKLLLEKAAVDNDLIDALRAEVATLREQKRDIARKTDTHAASTHHASASAVELSRLRRENSRLETQLDRAMVELRALKK